MVTGPRRSNPSDKWQTDWVSEEQPPCAPALFISLCKYGGALVKGERGQTGDRMRLLAEGFCQETPKQGQEKVSAEVGGAPEQFVAVPPDVGPSGDYRRDALSRRRQSVIGQRAVPSNNHYRTEGASSPSSIMLASRNRLD